MPADGTLSWSFPCESEHLGLHVFWSAKEELVLIPLWAAIMLAQVLASLRFQIAEADAGGFFRCVHRDPH